MGWGVEAAQCVVVDDGAGRRYVGEQYASRMATPADADAWVRAFPPRLMGDVVTVVRSLPAASHSTTTRTIDSERSPRGVAVEGKSLEIPARQYHRRLSRFRCWRMTPTQVGIAACIYSRHHDGYVRQSWLRELFAFDDPCVAPYVIQLVGEYVVEIVAEIESWLESSYPGAPKIQRLMTFAAENPGFVALTESRARSYWHEYYTYPYSAYAGYPASQVLARLSGADGLGS